jgi:hypothetical protein
MLRRTLIAVAALLASTGAQAEWVKASSKHFVVYSDDRPDAVKAYAVRLERFDAAVRSVLSLKTPEVSPSARVQVFVVPSTGDIQRLSGVSGAAGFYRSDFPSDIVAFIPRRAGEGDERSLTPQQVMLHEYTHHIMYSSFEGIAVPTWFSEGFAELFATARFDGAGSVTFGAPPLYRTYGIDMTNVVPVERLVRRGPDYHDGLQAQVFYGRSWLLTDYLMFDRDRSKQLAGYIAAINSGKSADEAARGLGVTSALDAKLDAYAHRSQWPAATIAPDRMAVSDVDVAPLSRGEAAMMPALIRSRNGVDAKQAPVVVAEARRLAAPFPSDAAAQNELAEAEYDAGDYAASGAAAGRALAADPRSVHAMIYKGRAEVAQLKKAGSKDPAAWATARRYFLAANKAEPLYSYPPQLYYESFGEAGVAAPKAAGDGLLWAYKLRPDLRGLRLEATSVLLRRGDKDGARTALEPLAFSAHGGGGVDLAKKVLAALDSGGTAAALTVLDHADDAKPTDRKS